MIGPIDMKQKGNESTGCNADKGTFDLDLWPWKSWGQIVSREWDSIVMERKGQESLGCPDVKHNPEAENIVTDGVT